jgi:integrase/recombinase XerD
VHSIPDPSRVRFTGPLTPYAPGLAEELAALGYTSTSATAKLQLAAQLSRWLEAAGVSLGELMPEAVGQFLQERPRSYASPCSARALAPVLGVLRRLGAVPEAAPAAAAAGPADVLLDRFGRYLAERRALTAPGVRAYIHWARPFAEEVLFAGGAGRPGEVSAAEVARFLAARLPAMSRKQAQMTACAVRSLLRFLHAEAMATADLTGVIPPVASWQLSGLPRALSSDEVVALLAACDISRPAGRRDFAMITLMCRLGLRCAEVAGLELDDVDWPGGTITVRGKAGRTDRMPLPADVGQALAGYLVNARPAAAGTRALFVRAKAPFAALGGSGVSCVVARAARRAGLGTVHGHRLRHTAATATLNAGATLEEVAQLLRHEGIATTVIYAKTDRARLAQLARPWPAAGDRR